MSRACVLYVSNKVLKSSVRQEHVRDTLEMRYMRVLYASCTLIYVAIGRCVFHACLGSKDFKHV